MSICPTRGGDCDRSPGTCQIRCALQSGPRPIDFLMDGVVPCLHFVGFRTEYDQTWNNAVRVFGEPDIVHRTWDVRAQQEIVWGWDTVVFYRYSEDDPPKLHSWDASNQEGDPAAAERS